MTAAAPTPPANGFRTFLVLWSTQTLSLFGSFVSYFAVNIWLVRDLYPLPAQKPALALALTATAVATTAPTIVLMPVAGAWADRHDRRRTLLAANVAGIALSLAMVALLVAGRLDVWTAVALLTAYSAVNAFHSASFDSGWGQLVPAARLQRAAGMMQTSYALAQLLGPALAAALIAVPALARSVGRAPSLLDRLPNGVSFAFAADAVSFAIAALAVAGVRLPPPMPRASHASGLMHDVREGLAWIVRRRSFVWLLAMGALANLTIAPLMTLLPLLVRDRLAGDLATRGVAYEPALAAANMAAGLGGVLGGVVVSAWSGLRDRRPAGMAAALLVLGVSLAVSGAATTLPVLVAAMFVLELPVPFLNTSSFALWQSLTPPAMLGRALSTRRFIAQSFYPLGAMLAGWLAVPIEPWIVATASGAALALGCAALLATPAFLRLEDRLRDEAAKT